MKFPRFMMALLAVSATLFLTQCGSDDPTPVKSADVYVAGEFNKAAPNGYNWVAAYWKNGVVTQLTDGEGEVEGMAVIGTDVYAAGKVSGGYKVTMWKNGVASDYIDGSTYPYVYGMKAFGNDIYVYGNNVANGNSKATYWKNGIAHSILTTYESTIYDIAVNGNDIYAAGFERNIDGYTVAKVWKNDVETVLSDGSTYGDAQGVAILNGDVYVVGNDHLTLKIWKNGAETKLGTEGTSGTSARSLAISGNDIYVAGYENKVAKLWKNGVATALTVPAGITETYGYSISVVGKEVIVSGEGKKGTNEWPVLVWKNNELVTGYDGSNSFSAYVMIAATPQ